MSAEFFRLTVAVDYPKMQTLNVFLDPCNHGVCYLTLVDVTQVKFERNHFS